MAKRNFFLPHVPAHIAVTVARPSGFTSRFDTPCCPLTKVLASTSFFRLKPLLFRGALHIQSSLAVHVISTNIGLKAKLVSCDPRILHWSVRDMRYKIIINLSSKLKCLISHQPTKCTCINHAQK